MAIKLIFQNIDIDGNVTSEKKYTSLKAIHKDMPNCEYHQLRQLWMRSMGHELKRNHMLSDLLYSKYRIINDTIEV
jgi:hypothetical protein